MAKKFMYVCVGMLALAGAYHLGAENTVAQSLGDPVVGMDVLHMSSESRVTLVTANGDIYGTHIDAFAYQAGSWTYFGNPWGPVASEGSSLNDLKAMFK